MPYRPVPPAPRVLALAALLLLPTLLVVGSDEAAADTTTVQGPLLPAPMIDSAAVWTGTYALIFGGKTSGSLRDILKYTPSTGTVVKMNAQFPSGLDLPMAVWTGQYAYIFGGATSGCSIKKDIWRYDPAADTLTKMNAELPRVLVGGAAVWTGTHAYILGGYSVTTLPCAGAIYSNQIIRYDPATDSIATMSATLPIGRQGLAAVWDGTAIYAMGGLYRTTSSVAVAAIDRYVPGASSATTVANLPSGRNLVAATYMAGHVYVFGGEVTSPTENLRQIVRFTPGSNAVTTLGTTLPNGRTAMSAVADGLTTYLFGGDDWQSATGYYNLDTIIKFTASPEQIAVAGALPFKRFGAAAAWVDGNAYVFGGHEGNTGNAWAREIVRVDESVNHWSTVVQRPFPNGLRYASAAVHGGSVYLFGGDGSAGAVNTVYRYVPSTNTLTAQAATLPTARTGTAAATIGNFIYVAGGVSGSTYHASILRYDPGLGTLTDTGAMLPAGVAYASAFAHDGKLYVIGGQTGAGAATAQIVRYDPATNSAALAAGVLPAGRYAMGAAAAGAEAILFGGSAANGAAQSQILKYEPGPDRVTVLTPTIGARYGAAAVSTGAKAYAFGGYLTGQIVRYDLAPTHAPAAPAATAGPGPWNITVSWSPPPIVGVTSYRIASSTAAVGPFTLLATVPAAELSYRDTGLPNGATRYYRVSAVTDGGETPQSAVVSATTSVPPGPPTDLAATRGPAAGEITLDWTPPASDGGLAIRGYRVQRAPSGAAPTAHAFVTGTSFVDTGLAAGARYVYSVVAVNDAGDGAPSNEVDERAFLAPEAPPGLVASTGPGVGEIGLSWGAPATELALAGYRVYRGASPGATTLLVELPADAQEHLDTGLPSSSTWWYEVAALSAAGEGARAAVTGGTYRVPAAPGGLIAARGPGVGEISLAWNAPASDRPISAYRVYRGPSSASLEHVADAAGTSYVDSGLPNATSFTYRVTAVSDAGEGAASALATAPTPGVPLAPRNLVAGSGPGRGQIRLSWLAPADDGGRPVTGYTVHRGTSPSDLAPVATLGIAFSWTDTGLASGAQYHYAVVASNEIGAGAAAGPVVGRAPDVPSEPRNLAATAAPGSGIRLSWQFPASTGGVSLSGFHVYRSVEGGPLERIATVGTTGTHTDPGCPLRVSCEYRVSAFNFVGEGAQSAAVTAEGVTLFPAVKIESGKVTVYNDADRDATVDRREEIAKTP